jgi:transcriptional regulator with XRE-family HTH domain
MDWRAVSTAIKQRMTELAMSQTALAERAGVSIAITSEIRNNTVRRTRSPRTLAALSVALGWHPGHLDAVLHGHPTPDEPKTATDKPDVNHRLTTIERKLETILRQLDAISTRLPTK